MAKSVMIDNDIHKNLVSIQTLIYQRKRYSINLGDIVTILLDKDPTIVADEIIKTIESSDYLNDTLNYI